MLAYFDSNIGWGELAKRTASETQSDNDLGPAAQLAYYLFLAPFAALLFFIALAGVFASPGLVTRVVAMLGGTAPPDVINIVRQQLISLAQGDKTGIRDSRSPGHVSVTVVRRPRRRPAAAFARTGVLLGGVIAPLFGTRIRG